jgi:hypothetical protein
MSLEDLGNIGEFVAAVAVVVSLVYVAVQIRQNTRSVRASSYQVAVRANVSRETVRRLERVVKVAHSLGASVADLIPAIGVRPSRSSARRR